MFEGFERKRVDVEGITINCVVAGSGPPLLMLHGYPQNMTMWAQVAPRLAEKFTVVCSDLRGYGDSSKPRCSSDCQNYSFRTMAADQVALMAKLRFSRFHVVGHDRGARTGHRMALDHPSAVETLSVLDVAPTYVMFMQTDRHVSAAYWHWYFLALPEPVPERLIGSDPDFFFEFCLVNWGKTPLGDFNSDMLDDYRRCWRDPAMIHGSCSDYRAAATVDFEHDTADLGRKIGCPTLALWGSKGLMHKHFDLAAAWEERASKLTTAMLPGSHFFIDQFPDKTSRTLLDFLEN